MTDSVTDYTYLFRHNSKNRQKIKGLSFLLVTALTLTGASHPSFAAGRDALISAPSPASAEAPAAVHLQAKPFGRTEARAERETPHRSSTSGVVAMVTEAAERNGVPVGLAHAIIKIESGYNCHARSRYGAAGIGQVLPASARAEGVSGNLYECGTGLEAAMRYLKHAVALYGSGCAAASAYNTGIFGAGRCTGYGRRAMRLAQLYK
jgi:soluble lytic murein transglycosylase-like protein